MRVISATSKAVIILWDVNETDNNALAIELKKMVQPFTLIKWTFLNPNKLSPWLKRWIANSI